MDSTTNKTNEQTIAECASCGKTSETLKTCTSCKLVKYCGIECQKSHWRRHKAICKKLAAEIYDEKLFNPPQTREDCPICFLPLPHKDISYMMCCGKYICEGCVLGLVLHTPKDRTKKDGCPFCRTCEPNGAKSIRLIYKRIEKNDPDSLFRLSQFYRYGQYGLPQDYEKAFELCTKAADLGLIKAYQFLGECNWHGRGTPKDLKKAKQHWEFGAMKGDSLSRHSLGMYEIEERKDHKRAFQHFMIAAKDGYKKAMECVTRGYECGYVTINELEDTLCVHQKCLDEMRSEQRDLAALLDEM
jgi:hypothetical protein